MTNTRFSIGTCLFEDRRNNDAGGRIYRNPVGLIQAHEVGEIAPALRALDASLAAGHHAAGYIGYEVGYDLEPRLGNLSNMRRDKVAPGKVLPLLRFWLFEKAELLSSEALDKAVLAARTGGHVISPVVGDLSKSDYMARVGQVLELIQSGDIYQANFTFPLRGHLNGDPLSLYAALRVAQPVSYGAFLRMEEADLLSLSPELFVSRQGNQLTTRPMKGTAARATAPADDEAARHNLRADPKERAENLMIVDLLRNDLSRVCEPGTVEVPKLFEVETYPSLHTMTSDVIGQLKSGARISDILRAMFPCGSVTGAPKIRAMEVIADLEHVPRGPYTGSIGFMEPGGDFSFNVAIRTLTAFADGSMTYPVGSGIVTDSDPAREYDECLLKARVLEGEVKPFDLIETLGWNRKTGFAFLERHLARLSASADFFGRTYDEAKALQELESAIVQFGQENHQRVRLTLGPEGEIEVTATPLDLGPEPTALRFVFSETPVDAANPILRHKTTRRTLYSTEFARQRTRTQCHEVVFHNQRSELTEGTWTNLFVCVNGELLTPPVSAGLLPGILRGDLLANGKVTEQVLTREMLERADAIYLGNSVRGLMPASLVGADEPVAQDTLG